MHNGIHLAHIECAMAALTDPAVLVHVVTLCKSKGNNHTVKDITCASKICIVMHKYVNIIDCIICNITLMG